MPRIVCPKCSAIVKISSQEEKTRVRCLECKYRIPVMEAEEYDPKKHKKKKPSALAMYLCWTPALALSLVALILGLISCSGKSAGGVAALIALLGFVGGMVWGAFLASDDGAHVGFDYLNLFGSSALTVMIIMIGLAPLALLYLLGYCLFLALTQLQYAFRKPGRYLPVLALEGLAFVMLVGVPMMAVVGDVRRATRSFTGDPEIDIGLRLLSSPQESERSRGASILVKITPDDRRPVVASALAGILQKTQQGRDRRECFRALAVWGTSDQVPMLLEMIGDPDQDTQRGVMECLGSIGDRRALPPMLKGLQKFETSIFAISGLQRMGPSIEEDLLEAFRTGDRTTRQNICHVLRASGTNRSIPILQAALADDQLRLNAQGAITAIQDRNNKK